MSDQQSEFYDITQYRSLLVGKRINRVDFTTDTDEGLVVTCEDGTTLYFGFSGSEGVIIVGKQ